MEYPNTSAAKVFLNKNISKLEIFVLQIGFAFYQITTENIFF